MLLKIQEPPSQEEHGSDQEEGKGQAVHSVPLRVQPVCQGISQDGDDHSRQHCRPIDFLIGVFPRSVKPAGNGATDAPTSSAGSCGVGSW